ncbi:hypothetical protein Acr_16g0002040 [Actinidia rufa]|uniref:Uncharacterized protein n=1 Tax=Actinidia rufa TaxID=165716 RepID=A0A7J0FZK6_9ERIC|nr:hypothetical protein Acr_16g0002040 [Actinidia rufa]
MRILSWTSSLASLCLEDSASESHPHQGFCYLDIASASASASASIPGYANTGIPNGLEGATWTTACGHRVSAIGFAELWWQVGESQAPPLLLDHGLKHEIKLLLLQGHPDLGGQLVELQRLSCAWRLQPPPGDLAVPCCHSEEDVLGICLCCTIGCIGDGGDHGHTPPWRRQGDPCEGRVLTCHGETLTPASNLQVIQRPLRNRGKGPCLRDKWAGGVEGDTPRPCVSMFHMSYSSVATCQSQESFVKHPLMPLECTSQENLMSTKLASQFPHGMHLPLMMGGVKESQSVSWLHSNENQHMLLSSQPRFLPQRDAECSTYPSTYPSLSNYSDYFSPGKTAFENTRPVDNMGQDGGTLKELDAAACLRLQLNDQYPYQLYSSLDLPEAKKLNPESQMNLQGHPLDYDVNSSVQLPRPIFDNLNHTWVPTSEPFTISMLNDNPYSQPSHCSHGHFSKGAIIALQVNAREGQACPGSRKVILASLLDKVTENDRCETHLLQVAEIRIWENEVASCRQICLDRRVVDAEFHFLHNYRKQLEIHSVHTNRMKFVT